MKLISWNCRGAYRKKASWILRKKPDILVIQECEYKDKLVFKDAPAPFDLYWHGDGLKKGIGIFSYSDYKFSLLSEFEPKFRHIIPLRVTGNSSEFIMLAVWAMDSNIEREARYIGQVWNAINHYEKLLGGSTLIVGDFNSNKIWDYKKRVGTHTDVVNKLATKGIQSVYHTYFNCEQGMEKNHPTFYQRRKGIERTYHIDYCFASGDLLKHLKSVDISSFDPRSDHAPLEVVFEI